MKIVKYILGFSIIGFIIGLVISISIVGISCSNTTDGCLHCAEYGINDGFSVLTSCMQNCFSSILGITCAGCGFVEGCVSCENPFSSCIDGCESGFKDFGGDCNKPFYHCGECANNCSECSKGCKRDVAYVHMGINNNSKAKNYIIYLTIIGAFIGTVFGIVATIQEKSKHEKEIQEAEERHKREIHEAEEKRELEIQQAIIERQQASEKKWEKMWTVLLSEKELEERRRQENEQRIQQEKELKERRRQENEERVRREKELEKQRRQEAEQRIQRAEQKKRIKKRVKMVVFFVVVIVGIISVCYVNSDFGQTQIQTRLLFKAIEKQNIKEVEKCIKLGANVNAKRGKDNVTPLKYAIGINNIEIAGVLLDAGSNILEANINWASEDGVKFLRLAINKENIEMVELLIKLGVDINLNTVSPPFIYLLEIASNEFHDLDVLSSIFDLLIKSGADINIKDNSMGVTPLICIAQHLSFDSRSGLTDEWYLKCAEKLLKLGADVNITDNMGDTALNRLMNLNEWYYDNLIFANEENKASNKAYDQKLISLLKSYGATE